MHGMYSYHIKIKGLMDEETFNATSPLQITITRADVTCTRLTVCTDQSGFIGILRHLHHQGFVILSAYRKE